MDYLNPRNEKFQHGKVVMKYLNILREDMEYQKKKAAQERKKDASHSSDSEFDSNDGDDTFDQGPGTPLITKEMKQLTSDPNMSYEKFSTDPFGKKEAAKIEKKKKEYLAHIATE